MLNIKYAEINTEHYIFTLETLIKELRQELEIVRSELLLVKNELIEVKAENVFLKNRIQELEFRPTSKNSSTPPSKDITRQGQTKSLRKASGKKPGGQIDHIGHHLNISDKPNITQDYKIDECQHCKHPLSDIAQTIIDRQQVIDLPPIEPIITEYRKYQAICPCCGQISQSLLPINEVKCKVQYGEKIRGLISYFNARQVITKGRVQELMRDVFSLNISQGTIVNIVSECALGMHDTYDQIREYIQSSPVVGSDESSCKISGINNWLWAYQNTLATYLYIHPKRGSAAIELHFPEGFSKSILVTDRWAAQLKTPSKGKQLCLQHLMHMLTDMIDCRLSFLNC